MTTPTDVRTDAEGPPAPVSPAATDRRPRRSRGRRLLILGATIAVVGRGGTAGYLTWAGSEEDNAAATPIPTSTTQVTQQTLTDTETLDGVLGFGPSSALSARAEGTITALPESGGLVHRDKTLYEVDGVPTLLMYGASPAYRDLSWGAEGRDVRQLERNLRQLGYTGFEVDNEFTEYTAYAVAQWQEDHGLEETGVIELGAVAFTPGPVRIDGLQLSEGDPAMPGTPVLTYTTTEKAVTVELELAEQRLAKKGAEVEVGLPDGSTVSGRITAVTTVAAPAEQGEEAETTIELTVELVGAKAQRAAQDFAFAAVDVTFTAGERKGVLTVPVTALVALSEGGYGVEVIEDGVSRFVPVETGLFSGGMVEISGAGISEDTTVGVPE